MFPIIMKKRYYSIGEVCNLLQLPDHTVRYWETEFKQLSPNKLSGRKRQYSKKDIKLLEEIKYMLHTQGYAIKGVKKILNNRTKKNDFVEEFDRETLKKQILKAVQEIENILAE